LTGDRVRETASDRFDFGELRHVRTLELAPVPKGSKFRPGATP
jgi:hypothetical protein